MESRKLQSWMWGRVIRSKTSKWLSENLKEMERNVNQMLKLIEEDGDSFAQKAEMYYKKRPELISLVEEFYRGYKSMVERFDHINTPSSDLLQSQSSSDYVFDQPPSSNHHITSSPRKIVRRISTNRAPGFDVFLGSSCGNVNNSSFDHKDGDASSTLTDTDEDYDDASSINSFSGFFGNGTDYHNSNTNNFVHVHMHEEERVKINAEDFRAKISAYEQEIRNLNEKLRLSMESTTNLKGGGEAFELKKLREELRVTNEKLESSEMQIVSLKFGATRTFETIQQLREQLDLAEKDIASWKTKFNSQRRENSKLQEKYARMRTSVAERDHEVRDLKASLCEVERKIFFERANVKSEMSKLLGEQTHLGGKFKEWECQCQALEDEIRKIHSEKRDMGETLRGEIQLLKEDIEERKKSIEYVNVSLEALKLERDNLKAEVGSLKEMINSRDNEIERQRVEIIELAAEKREAIRQLCFSLEHYRNGYNLLREAFIGNRRVLLLAN